MKKFDVIIIGGGPGGSTAAAVLARKGLNVAIIEREEYPRFHIGESLLPASMPIYKETGFYEKLSGGKYIEKYGARFIDYKTDDMVYFGFNDGVDPSIPMAFEVERCHFDKDILQHAVDCGATLFQPENVLSFEVSKMGAQVTTNKDVYQAEYLIDVSGRDSVIGKKMGIRNVNKALNNVAVFAHYEGVERYEGKSEGDITIGLLPDRAWTWIIPFKGNKTSVGVVASSNLFEGTKDLGAYLEQKLNSSPTVARMMKNAKRVEDYITIGNYSHTCDQFYGDRWILSGDAALFLDPIFSSGVHMSCSSSKFAAETILQLWDDKGSFEESGLGKTYEEKVRLGGKRFFNLISMFYEGDFVGQMKKTLTRDNVRRGFTGAVAGDVWNSDNFLFSKQLL